MNDVESKLREEINVKTCKKLDMLALMSVFLCVISLQQIQIVTALPYTDIDVNTAYEMIMSGVYPDLVILDVRTQAEFKSGHIQDAILIPYTELEERIGELTEHKDHEIIVHCRTQGRSGIACGILDAYAFTKVYRMLGGMTAWKAAGYPVLTGSIPANIDIDPDTLNLRSNSRWITAYIELQGGYDVSDVNISATICFYRCPCNYTHAELHPTQIGDHDNDGIPDLMVKFDRSALIALLSMGEATLMITGEVNGRTPFEGTDTIRVID